MQTGDVTQIMNTLQLSQIDFAFCYLLVCRVNTKSTRSLSQERACHLLDNIAIVTNVTGHWHVLLQVWCDDNVTGLMFVYLSFSQQTSLRVFNIATRHLSPASIAAPKQLRSPGSVFGWPSTCHSLRVKINACESENKKTWSLWQICPTFIKANANKL